MIKKGSWQVRSDSDPRWNNHGECAGDSSSVPDMDAWIAKCRAEFGDPPADAMQSFYKD